MQPRHHMTLKRRVAKVFLISCLVRTVEAIRCTCPDRNNCLIPNIRATLVPLSTTCLSRPIVITNKFLQHKYKLLTQPYVVQTNR